MNNLSSDKNRRVLVIDDNHAIHDDFRKILSPATSEALDVAEKTLFGATDAITRTQFEVDSAYQGQEGVSLVEKAIAAGRPYAMAFVDVRMPPGWDGVETAAKLWEIDRDLQIVICTAYSDYSWEEMYTKLGQRDGLLILKKPFDAVEALQLAHALTEKWWLHQQSRRKLEELENMVVARTGELHETNQALQAEVAEHRRLAEELIRTEGLYRRTIAGAGAVPYSYDYGTESYLFMGEGIEALVGYSPQQMTRELWKQITRESVMVGATSGMDKEEAIRRVLAGEIRTWCCDTRVITRQGKVRWISDSSVPNRDASGRAIGAVGILQDITERKQAEISALAFSQLGQRLSSAASVREAFDIISEVSRELFRWNAFCIRLYSAESDSIYPGITIDTVNGQPVVEEQIEPEKPGVLYRRIIERGGELILRDHPTAPVPGAIPFGDVSRPSVTLMFVPIRSHGPVVGLLSVQSYTPHAYNERDLQTLQTLADQCGGAFERIWAEEARFKSESQFRLVWNASADGMRLTNRDGIVLMVNAAYGRMVGKTKDELEGQLFSIIQDKDRAGSILQKYQEQIDANVVASHAEKEITLWDGRKIWLELSNSLLQLPGQPSLLLSIFRDITERKRAEMAVRDSNDKFHQLADNITDAFWIRSPDMREVHYVSPAFERIWGRSVASLYANPQQWADFIQPEDRERVLGAFASLTRDAANLDIEYRIVRPAGEVRWIHVRGFRVRNAADQLVRHLGIVTDITERKKLEARLFESQKLETVGKLAGGVAHEFNNIMTAIIGQSELMLLEVSAGSSLSKNAVEIRKAAERAAALTRQLLAYGRKQFLQPEILNLNSTLSKMESTLHHLMGRKTEILLIADPDLKTVKADAGQIEQVILNIAMNAADAMPGGGKLTIETANVSLEQEYVDRFPEFEMKPGEYSTLAITDTGIGMSAKVKARAFDPFYTTKDIGQGTGLGLSTCYGIIKQSGGHITVYSEPGRGTTFKIYLPQVEQQTETRMERLKTTDLPQGTETVLLVEDDPALREMSATLLKRLGYTVLAASSGIEALSMQQSHPGQIDLLFTDVVMPGMTGKELADRVQTLYPHLRILFTSAYTGNAIAHQGALDKGVVFLQKPFTPSALAQKLREALDLPAVPKADLA